MVQWPKQFLYDVFVANGEAVYEAARQRLTGDDETLVLHLRTYRRYATPTPCSRCPAKECIN